MTSHGVSCLAIENVIKPRLGSSLITQSLEEQQRVGDTPPCVGIDPNKSAVPGRHLVPEPVPLQEPSLKHVGGLDERQLEMESRFGDRLTHRFTEPRNDGLVDFAHGVHGATEHEQDDQQQHNYDGLTAVH